MNRPVIKFLSARTGKYEFATVDGLGDIALLQTRIKTDIVSAINELIVEGIAGGLTEEDRDRINDIGNSVDSLKNGTFQITEWGSVDEYYQDKLNATIEIINRSNKETIELEKEQVREIIETAISDYEQNVADINVLMESARQNVSNAEDLLAQKAAELETANIDYRELTQVVDVINGVIQDKVQTIDFDLFNAMTTDYQTLVTQTAQKWGVEASLDSLSYMSGRVESNQASLEVQNNMIQGKVGYNEWQYLPVNIGEYNDNLLKYTRDLTEGWERSNTAIYVTSETFQHTKIAAIEQNGAFYHTSNSDDLEVGRTYVASIWVNIQERNKNATDAKYAPNNTIHEVNLMLGTESNVTEIHEDLRGVNGWAQHYVTFVADESNPRFAPIVKFNHNTQIAYITAPKLEEGLTVTGWQPHVDDDYATIYSSHSLIRQQGNEIATFVNEVKVLEDSYQEATSSFSQIADGFELNTRKIEEYEEAVLEYGSQVKAFNDSFSAKVWESDFQNAVSDINIDNRNRVFNSAFDIIDYNETTRETDIVFWDGNDGKITELIGEHGTKENHLQLSRTGVQNVNITSMTSNKFKSRYGERLIFSFNSIISGLDADNIFALEIFDISDVRLFKKEFSLTELTAEPLANGVVRYSGSYTIAHEDTAKARVVIQLPKNGNININKLLVQGADIGTTDWTPAPEDSQLVRSRQEAEISVLKDEIGLRVTKESIDQSSGLVINEEGNITINPATIIQRVTNVELLGDEALIDGTIFDQKVDGWRQRLVEDGTVINDINASPGLYQINFDRVAIDGELLARMISTYDLDIANGFRLVNGNIPVIAANAVTGEVELNVTKLTINAIPAATQEDLEAIELTPGPKGDKGDAGKDAVTVHIKSATGTAFEYNAEGQLGSVKQKTIEATYTGTIVGTVYYEFLIDGYSQRNEITSSYTYKAPTTYAAMPQVVEVRIRQGSKTGTVLASNILTYTGIKPGADGEQGIKGDDGRSQYTHIAYAQSADGVTGFNTSSSEGATYIGMYTSFDSDDSQTPSDYNWSLIKGADGSQGIQGPRGSDGLTPYLHIAYATGPSGEGFSVLEGEDKTYIGVYTDNISDDSEDWRKYTWSLIRGPQGEQGIRGLTGAQGDKGDQGIQGAKGVDGKPSYTHIAYADTITGAGFSHNDASKAFIGIYADDQETSSETASKYTWSKWHGEDGDQGVQGPQGINGKPSYTHFAYANNSTGTTGFSTSDSLNKTYLGIYTDDLEDDSQDPKKYNWTLIKGAQGAQGPRGVEGLQGPKGDQGIKGATGEDGLSQYTHIAYADNDTGTLRFSLSDSNREYVGMYTDFEPDDSSVASKYKWTLIKGRDGSRGIEGPKGTDGLTPYLHIAYANSADGVAGFSTNNSTNKLYIGTYTDYIEEDPTNPALYSWTLVKGEKGDQGAQGPRGVEGAQGPKGTDGIQGPKGADGKPSYTHIAYADNINGGGFSHNDATKPFIGIYADDQTTSSDVVSKYTWSKWHGQDGDQGVQGPRGVDGKPSYTHFAYATNADGTTGFSTTESLNKTYLGIYTDDLATDSQVASKYKWTLIKGAQGAQGPRGIQGLQGPDGSQGIQGPKGIDGKSEYTHIAYSNSADGTVEFSTSDSNREYVGMYVDNLPDDSTVPSKYKWTLVKGRDGSNGIQGPKGTDGRTQYLHIAYANNATGTVGFSVNDSLNKLYIGTYTDFTEADSADESKYSWTLVKGEKGESGPRGLEGLQGNKGDQGIQGPKGDSSYTHIAYATSATGENFNHSTFPTATYIGMYVDNLPGSSGTASKYQWTLIKGADGSQGIEGPKGTDGKTPYFHTAWATNATGTTGFSTKVSTGKTHIGTYTDYTSADSEDPTKYKWVLVKGETGEQGPRGTQGIQGPQGDKGIQGEKGVDGKSQYTHIGYATSSLGANFSHSTFESATYIGMYVDNTEESSSTPSKYEWTLIKGKDGTQGIQGPQGADGKTPYFHTAWATSPTGAGFSTTVSAGKTYIGTYTNYVAEDSDNWADYRWTLIKGEKGDPGSQGIQGPQGKDGTSSYTHIAYGTSTTGANFNKTNFADATFIGIATTTSATSPTGASAYTWSEFKGKDGSNGIPGPKGDNGLTPYFHQAWADDEDGNGFTLLQSASIGKKYYGSFWDFTMADSTNRADYTWQPYTDWLRDEIEGVRENFGELAFADKTDLLSGNPIWTDKADENGIVHVGVDGLSIQDGMPTPDNPIEIVSLNDFDVVSSAGKENLLKDSKKEWKTAREYVAPSYNLNEIFDKYPIGQTYTISFDAKSDDPSKNSSLQFYSNPGSTIQNKYIFATRGFTGLTTEYQRFSHTIIPNLSADPSYPKSGMSFYGQYDTGNIPTIRNIKIELGATATSYSPAPEDIVGSDNHASIDKINLLLDEPLRSVGDVKDRLFRDVDGLWKVERKTTERIISGGMLSYRYGLGAQGINTFYTNFPNAKIGYYTSVSSHFKSVQGGWDRHEQGIGYSDHPSTISKYFYFPDSLTGISESDNTSIALQKINNWLALNPVSVVYQLANPVIETLPQSLQDKLNNLSTFKDSNYVYTVLSDKSGILTPELTATFKSRAWANDHRAQYNASKAMHTTDVWYAKGVSNTIAPIIGWSTDAPKWEDGLFIWSKTITTYGDGHTSETDPICITGATGRSVDKIEELYYLSTSATALAGDVWKDTAPTWAEGKYIWTKSKITYKNPTGVEETKPINTTGHRGSVGQTGASGVDAKVVRLNNMTHAVHFNQEGTNPSVSSILFSTAIQGFDGLTPSYEFKQGNTVVRGLSTASTWTLNTSAMTYDSFPLSITVNVVINGQTLASDTATIVATKPGQDAYTVVMANESHTFRGDVSNALAGSTVANVIAYKGATQVGATIGTITGLPTGMTATIASNGTTAARITFSVTTAMVTGNGSISIPITVDGKAFTKSFTYAIAFKGEIGARGATGATGSTGPRGAEGVSVSSVTEYYLATASDSGVTTATAGWTTTLQTITAAKKHLWNYEVINFSDGTKQPTIPVIIGVYGDKGDSGANGRSVVSITEYYLATTASSGVTRSTSGWTTAMQTTDQSKRYLWNYETITWNVAPLVTYVEPIVIGVEGVNGKDGNNGTNGVAGKDGVGIKTTTINYASSTSGTATPTTGWQATVPTVAAGNYLWTRTTWTYTDNSVENGYSVARIGKDGNTGSDGVAGKDGVGIKSTAITYVGSTSGTTTPSSGWVATVPSVSAGSFLWTRTIWTYTDNTTETGYSVARMGANGAPGAAGAKGAKGDSGENATARNFLLDSKPKSVIHTSAYNITNFTLAEAPVVGETYSFALKGELAPTKTSFAIYNSGGQAHLGRLVSKGSGIYTVSFVWTNTIPSGQVVPTYISIYTIESTQTGASKIEWVTMVKGSVPLIEWVPAHEDIYKYVDDVEIGGANLIKDSATPRIMLPRNSGVESDNFNFIQIQAPMKSGETYTLSFDANITHGSFSALDMYTQYGHTSTTRHSIVGGRVVATFTAVATTNTTITYIYAGVASATRGNGLIISNYKLEKGNKATDWSPAPEDVALDVNKKTYNPVRYIRDWSNGSTENAGNHWYELMAFDEYGNNRALGGTVSSNGTGTNFSHLTNGVTAMGTYVSATNSGGPVYLQVDLGEIYYNIVEIKVWKYYNDGRIYNENKTEVSSDGVAWYPIYDYTVEGEYTPTEQGKSIPNTIAKTHSILTGTGTKNIIDKKADSFATEVALNEAAAKLQVLQQEVEAAATGEELKNFVAQYNKEQEALNADKATSEKNLSDAMISIDAITNNMGDMSETWKFVDRSIRNTPQGIVIGNESSGSFIRINEQEIGFFSNGQRVAFVAQNVMQIDKGIFVEEIQVAKYKFEESTTNHLTIRYVG